MKISRRTFLAAGATSAVAAALGGYAIHRMGTSVQPERSPMISEVFIVSTSNRAESIKKLLGRFDLSGFKGARVALKANYNSADPFPASTHIDTLRALFDGLHSAGVGQLFLAERSGMGDTGRVLEATGVMRLANELGVEVFVLDELPADGWVDIKPEGLHWTQGFKLPKILRG